MARLYERQKISDEAAYRKKLEKTREYFTPDSRVLELGCGTGTTAVLHAPYVGRIRAVDFSKNMIAIAQDKASAAGIENIDFEVASVDAFEAGGVGFDAVLMMSILHLLDNRREVLDKVFGLVKPGGVFVSSTVCVQKSGMIGVILPVGRALGILPTINFLTKEKLLEDIRDAGFKVEHEWQPGNGMAVFVVARRPGPGRPTMTLQ